MVSVSYRVYMTTNGEFMIPKIEQKNNIQKWYKCTSCLFCNCVFLEILERVPVIFI